MSTAAKQPTLFEVFGRTQSPIIPEINEGALEQLTSVLGSSGEEMGKVILLRSPRAGYGKTLLLQGVSGRLNEDFRFLAVEPSGGGRIDGEVVLESVLRQLSDVLPASGGLTEFDLFARKLLALGLKPLLISGEIPSHDREGALFAIENRPIETFDFHHQQAATAHWTQANFEVLGPRLASELSEISRCNLRGCAYWIDLLFRYATTPPEKVERTRLLSDAVFGDLQGQPGSAAEERLQSLLALLCLIEPVVLVFDETEGLSNQPDAGLRVAAFIVQLRQACPALTVVLSVNEDVWETGLKPLMPGGLADRLTEYEVSLEVLSRADAEILLKSRFGEDALQIQSRMSWPEPLFARAVLREGAKAARELTVEGAFSLEEPTLAAGATAFSSPPPLDGVTMPAGQESFEEKAGRILEPTSAFESEETIGFEAAPSSVVEQEPPPFQEAAAPPPVEQEDPFAEAEVVSENTETTPSPFEIASKEPQDFSEQKPAEAQEATPAETSSPFQAVEPEAVVEASAGAWSAESAVEHFAASQQTRVPAPEPPRGVSEAQTEQSVGSAFDAVETPSPSEPVAAPEPSPFQVLKEEKERLEAEERAKEAATAALLAAQKATTPVRESSPFSVSSPVQESVSETPPPQDTAQEAAPSPFAIHESERVSSPEQMRSAPVSVSHPEQGMAPKTQADVPPATARVESRATAPVTQSAPVSTPTPTTEAAPAKSPFAAANAPAATSPFASTPASVPANKVSDSVQETEDVEELLNQFKKRFGQSDS